MARILIDIGAPDLFSASFFGPFAELLTKITPLFFHFHNLFSLRRYTSSSFLFLFHIYSPPSYLVLSSTSHFPQEAVQCSKADEVDRRPQLFTN